MTWTNNVTLEISFGFNKGPLDSSPSWTNVTTAVRELRTSRGRSSTRAAFDAGAGLVILDNTSGDYSPNNTSSPYFGGLRIGTPVRIRATHSVTTYDVFRGYVSKWPLMFHDPNEANVPLEITERSGLLRSYALQDRSYSEQASHLTVGDILDDVGWPALDRNLETGAATVAGVTFSGSAGTLLDHVVQAEQGWFFVAANGDATFYNRTHYAAASASADWGGAGGLAYSDVVFEYGSDWFVNRSTITGADNDAQSASDATSITNYGPSPLQSGTFTNPVVLNAAHALNVAETLVAVHKDIALGVRQFTVYPDRDQANMYPKVLGASGELGAVVNVEYSPPAGSAMDQDVRIESVEHHITPGSWASTFGCYPLSTHETRSFWVLGTSTLGTGTVLA